MNICLFSQQEITEPLNLNDERAQHLLKILHKKEGDTFSAGIIGGMAGLAKITSIEKHEVSDSKGRKYFEGKINFSFTPLSDGKKLNNLIMIIGFPRPIQLKRLLRDMAGLGVCQVHLTASELTEKSYLESDLATTDAGNKMLLEGSVQAASTHVPLLVKHNSLAECLESVNNSFSKYKKIALDNINSCASLTDFLDKEKNICGAIAAVGSERGWTDKERKLLEDSGFTRLSMGNRVLRTETASTVAASIILSKMGIL